MKKKLFVLAVLVIILAGMATGTLAYYTAKSVAHNVITSGEIDIALVETMDHDGDPKTPEVEYPENPVNGIMPGQSHSKIVRVENVGSNDAWVRVKVTKKVSINGNTLSADVLTLDIDDTKWIKVGDYYYYNEKLPAGGKTVKPLFTTVYFAGPEMGDEYQNTNIEIGIQAYATQVVNNGETVLEAEGWPADIMTALFG